jgi:hypothetical protein
MKKTLLNIFGVLVLLVGIVWFFQGIGVIKGSFMTSTTQWTVIGLVCIVVAIVLLKVANGRKKDMV